ncbi:hypothetical protein SprV_1002850000 [Sparganum proliferum]
MRLPGLIRTGAIIDRGRVRLTRSRGANAECADDGSGSNGAPEHSLIRRQFRICRYGLSSENTENHEVFSNISRPI